MKKQNLVLCDTTFVPSYEYYKEWCEMNEVEPQGEDSNDYWKFVEQMQTMEWEDLLENLSFSEYENYQWVVTGGLGLWWGVKYIRPHFCSCLTDALITCCSRDIQDVIVTKRNSVIYVEAIHHDGTNRFELRALTPLGSERLDKRDGQISLKNRENIQTLPKYLF